MPLTLRCDVARPRRLRCDARVLVLASPSPSAAPCAHGEALTNTTMSQTQCAATSAPPIVLGTSAAANALTTAAASKPDATGKALVLAMLTVSLAAETPAEAERLYSSRALWRLSRDRGIFVAMPSPEEAAAHPWTDTELARAERQRRRAFIGTGAEVVAKLRALTEELGASEAVLLSTAHDPEARRRSYALVAEAAGLAAQRVALAAE